MTVSLDAVEVPVLSRDDFVVNERASARPKDLTDLALLDEEESAQ